MDERTLTTVLGKNMLAKDFADNFDDSSHVFYSFVAKHTPFVDDEMPDSPNDSDSFIHYETAKDIIFGKKLSKNNMMRSVRHIPWKNGKVFSMYDDNNKNLYNEDFYCCTKEGATYSVFKCIDNNYDSPSTHMPVLSETSDTDLLYETIDGYKWKYMYSFSETENLNFTIENNSMPCKINDNVASIAVNGSFSNILVEDNGNISYNSYCEGYFRNINISGNNLIHSIQSNDILSSNNDFYKNCSIYIDSGTGAGQLKRVNTYIVIGSERRIIIDSPFDILPDFSSHFKITPSVKIIGDGEGASAITNINTVSNTINSIEIIDNGKNYTYANIEILSNTDIIGESIKSNAVKIRHILSPKNGHGSNPFNELNSDKVVISTIYEGSEGNNIPITNDFRKAGLLLNPLMANCIITVENTNGIIDDQIIYQNNSGFKAKVSAVNLDGVDTVRLTDILNIPDLTENIIVSNSSVNEIFSTKITKIDKDLSIFDNRDKYSIEFITSNTFIEDERVYQKNTNAFGFVHSINNDIVYLTGVTGTFNLSNDTSGYVAEMIGEKSKAVAKVNGYIGKDLVYDSGDIVSIKTFEPILRNEDQNERIKFLIEF